MLWTKFLLGSRNNEESPQNLVSWEFGITWTLQIYLDPQLSQLMNTADAFLDVVCERCYFLAWGFSKWLTSLEAIFQISPILVYSSKNLLHNNTDLHISLSTTLDQLSPCKFFQWDYR